MTKNQLRLHFLSRLKFVQRRTKFNGAVDYLWSRPNWYKSWKTMLWGKGLTLADFTRDWFWKFWKQFYNCPLVRWGPNTWDINFVISTFTTGFSRTSKIDWECECCKSTNIYDLFRDIYRQHHFFHPTFRFDKNCFLSSERSKFKFIKYISLTLHFYRACFNIAYSLQ